MSNIIIGTAGHIDHGKTTLIKALTGIMTDTTQEEKERGMSINLGFAYFDLPSGKRVGIIDVPGHEKFIKNMLAGAQGINMILLVIDAGEGVMPQTVEHANILNLLGVENYIIALTKCDLVDDELIDLVEEDIRSKFKGTAIEKAPIVRVDSVSKRGFIDLINEIEVVSKKVLDKNLTSDPRLNIDRVFSVKGFGTIVTGTLVEGILENGQDLMLYTKMMPVKVRNIQVHEQNVDRAEAGMRTAINLGGVKVTDINRGDVLSKEGLFTPSYILDAKITVLKEYNKPIKLWDRVRVYTGTKEVMARVVPLGTEIINPGEEGFIQLRLEEEIISKPGDRLILRQYSPMVTLGGGVILDSTTVKHRRFDEEIIKKLENMENFDDESQILDILNNSEKNILTKNELLSQVSTEKAKVEEKIEEFIKIGKIFEINDAFISQDKLEEIKNEFVRLIGAFHKANPLKNGIPKEELKSKMKYMVVAKYYNEVLEKVTDMKSIIVNMNTVSLPDFKVEFTKNQEKIKDDIISKLKSDKFSPRSLKELTKDKGYREVMDSLMDGEVIRIDADIVLLKEDFKKAYEIVIEEATKNESITLAVFRDRLDTSRKYAVAILDYLDKAGVTLRKEDIRVLTNKRLTI